MDWIDPMDYIQKRYHVVMFFWSKNVKTTSRQAQKSIRLRRPYGLVKENPAQTQI
jgi:hypothetical protein